MPGIDAETDGCGEVVVVRYVWEAEGGFQLGDVGGVVGEDDGVDHVDYPLRDGDAGWRGVDADGLEVRPIVPNSFYDAARGDCSWDCQFYIFFSPTPNSDLGLGD